MSELAWRLLLSDRLETTTWDDNSNDRLGRWSMLWFESSALKTKCRRLRDRIGFDVWKKKTAIVVPRRSRNITWFLQVGSRVHRDLEGWTRNSRIPEPGFHYSEKYLGRGMPENQQSEIPISMRGQGYTLSKFPLESQMFEYRVGKCGVSEFTAPHRFGRLTEKHIYYIFWNNIFWNSSNSLVSWLPWHDSICMP
jgi:hypothetical protein